VLAVLPTLIAILAGVALGLSNGGRVENLLAWRPVAWKLAVGGLAVQLLFKILPLSGGFAVVLDIVSMAALIAFALLNIRVGGMVVVVIGLSLNLLPTLVDWGTPVSPNALVTAGLVSRSSLDDVHLEGPRHLQDDGDSVAWLGEVIALPTHQAISLGDLILLLGEMLVVSALLRNRHVEHAPAPSRRRTQKAPMVRARRAPSAQFGGSRQRRGPPARRPPPAPAPQASAPKASASKAPTPKAKTNGRLSYEEAMARLDQQGGSSKGSRPVRRPRNRDEQLIDLRDPVTRDRRS
jgi:hypothetical protein